MARNRSARVRRDITGSENSHASSAEAAAGLSGGQRSTQVEQARRVALSDREERAALELRCNKLDQKVKSKLKDYSVQQILLRYQYSK